MVITFGIILIFTSIREGVEDYQRYKKDKKANEKKHVYYNDKDENAKGFDYKISKKVRVGDIIKIFKDEETPADICLFKSSNRNGISFVDTVNLDGESNLKDKKCNSRTQNMSDIQLCNLTAVLKCEKPNDQLDYWDGLLTVYTGDENGDPFKILLE
jgi:P-type E1-E2 ATPase